MEVSKIVTSRKGNMYKIYLSLEGREITYFRLYILDGESILEGSVNHYNDSLDEKYLIKATEDIILFAEEKYLNYSALKNFENWKGIIK